MTATLIGTTNEKAATPTMGMRGMSICSVAYADEEMTSEDSTARAVGFPRRSEDCRSEAMGGPSNTFFRR
jgi:hypothetical protein